MNRYIVLLPILFSLGAVPALADGAADANAGMAALDRNDYAAAVKLFTKAIEHGKLSHADKESAYLERAKAHVAQKQKTLALRDLQQALALSPDDAEAVALRGQLRAPAAPGDAANKSPDTASDANAGMAALDRGDYAAAVELFTKAIDRGKLSPDDMELAYLERGKAHMGEKRNSLAQRDLEHAVSLNPQDDEAVSLLDQLRAPAAPADAADKSADTLNTQVHDANADADASYQRAQASYKSELDNYEAEKAAAAAKKSQDDASYAAALAAWQAKVASCKSGDASRCN